MPIINRKAPTNIPKKNAAMHQIITNPPSKKRRSGVVHRCRRYLANSKALGAPIHVEQQGHQERWTETQSVASASAEPLNEIFFRIETSGWGPSPTRLLRSVRSAIWDSSSGMIGSPPNAPLPNVRRYQRSRAAFRSVRGTKQVSLYRFWSVSKR